MNTEESYRKNLLKIFDSDYNSEHNDLYNRSSGFKKVLCNFVINRFKIENKQKYKEFIDISQSLIKKLKELYGPGKFWNIQVAKMQGGGEILPHIDSGLGFVFSHRIHIPLITNENVIFKIDNEKFYFPAGYAYEINNTKTHSVVNNNDLSYNRIHIILDYVSNEYISYIEPKEKNIKLYYQ